MDGYSTVGDFGDKSNSLDLLTLYDPVVTNDRFTIESVISEVILSKDLPVYRVTLTCGAVMVFTLTHMSSVAFACSTCKVENEDFDTGVARIHGTSVRRLGVMGSTLKCLSCGHRAPGKNSARLVALSSSINYSAFWRNYGAEHWSYRTRPELRERLLTVYDQWGLDPLTAIVECETLAEELDTLKAAAENKRVLETYLF